MSRIGLSLTHSKVVSKMLVRADERGVWSHGIVRLLVYVQRLNKNAANPKPKLKFKKISQSAFHLNGDNRLGFISANEGMK